jgi:mRNA-degrading endonuclease RelE of RelBE toxin-antitoxin system
MEVRYTPTALAHLEAFEDTVSARILQKVHFFSNQKDPLKFAKRLSGYKAYRFRVGNYRVIFEISAKVIYVLVILKRGDAYRDL